MVCNRESALARLQVICDYSAGLVLTDKDYRKLGTIFAHGVNSCGNSGNAHRTRKQGRLQKYHQVFQYNCSVHLYRRHNEKKQSKSIKINLRKPKMKIFTQVDRNSLLRYLISRYLNMSEHQGWTKLAVLCKQYITRPLVCNTRNFK